VKKIITFILLFIIIFLIDQYLKLQILKGFRWESQCLSITFTLNRGVAFSMFSFFDEYLKYLQIALISGVFAYTLYKKVIFQKYYIALSILLGAAVSNVLDRFIHKGVVDYIYYHCGFDFAIFNFADIMIDFSVLLILLIYYKSTKDVSFQDDTKHI